jgi:hypothetical protein
LKSSKDNIEKDYKSWEKKKKIDIENSKILQIFCLYNLGIQKEVCYFHLLFILVLPLKDLIHCLSLKKLLKQLERTIEITKKLWTSIILESLEDKKVQVNTLVRFPFLASKRRSRGMIYNNIKKHHHSNKSLHTSIL